MSLLSTPIVGRPKPGAPEVDSSGDEYYSDDDTGLGNGGRRGPPPAYGQSRGPLAGGPRRGTNQQLSGPPPRTTSLDAPCAVSP